MSISRSWWLTLIGQGLLASAMAAATTDTVVATGSTVNTPPSPRLIVAISIDQFSANLYAQYRETFSQGLKRLTHQGVVFPNGYQSHAATETCPGHATILTGRHPSASGIIANEWLDARTGKTVYCVYDKENAVPGRPDKPRGPAHLRVSTLGEWLKARNRASRTVAVAGKDRSAIAMAGHTPDAVFWWDDERGFNTYVPKGMREADRLAPVQAFNDAIAQQWAKALPEWQPARKACAALESKVTYDGLEISHRIPPDWKAKAGAASVREDANFKLWVRGSPVLDQLTLDLATSLIKRYGLGKGAATDVLAVGLSATDYVGHRFGSQGPEMCDQLAHLDRLLGVFLQTIDALQIPYIVALTADHGAVDAAERVVQTGFPAQRIVAKFADEANQIVRQKLNLHEGPLRMKETGVYVVGQNIPAELRERIVALTLEYLKGKPEIAGAFTRRQALETRIPRDTPPDELTLIERFAESVDAERSPDIMIAFKPYGTLGKVEPSNNNYIVAHGSPWNYDRRVPIIFWWPGARGFEQGLPIETVDIAPTLAAIVGLQVGIQTPPLDGRCIDLDRGRSSTCM